MICLKPFCRHCPTANPDAQDLLKSDPCRIVPWVLAGPFPCTCDSHWHTISHGTLFVSKGLCQPLFSQPPYCCGLTLLPDASAAIYQLEGTGKARICLCGYSGLFATLAFHLPAVGARSFQPCLCWRDMAWQLLHLKSSDVNSIIAVLPHSLAWKTSCCLSTERQWREGVEG